MSSNAPYYQSVPTSDQHAFNDFDLATNMLEYGIPASQAPMYPEPSQSSHEYIASNQTNDMDPTEHAQLHDLVEAATSAAAREQSRRNDREEGPFPYPEPSMEPQQPDGAKRTHSMSFGEVDGTGESGQVPGRPKRRKQSGSTKDQTQPLEDRDGATQSTRSDTTHLIDARAIGVHSAAALFRPPSDLSKKYTRPPMSKLFTSLQLTPERFLNLQSAAKRYMLDPEHPERQACVGNRGNGDTGATRLELKKCVHRFLEGGMGEEFFGVNAPSTDEAGMDVRPGTRDAIWPKNAERIVALCTPLLRRMVTNERQRQYAVETRKGGKTDKDGNTPQNEGGPSTDGNPTINGGPYDPQLGQGPATHMYLLDATGKQLLRDRVDLPPNDSINWDFIVQVAQAQMSSLLDNQSLENTALEYQIMTSRGLTKVSSDDQWQLAVQDVCQTVWLESLVKVVVSFVAISRGPELGEEL